LPPKRRECDRSDLTKVNSSEFKEHACLIDFEDKGNKENEKVVDNILQVLRRGHLRESNLLSSPGEVMKAGPNVNLTEDEALKVLEKVDRIG
jgi:Skp family chaperone for outer membrane proteins